MDAEGVSSADQGDRDDDRPDVPTEHQRVPGEEPGVGSKAVDRTFEPPGSQGEMPRAELLTPPEGVASTSLPPPPPLAEHVSAAAEPPHPVSHQARGSSVHEADEDLERVRPRHRRRLSILASIVALGVAAATVWFVLRPSGSTEPTDAAVATGNIADETPMVDRARALLDDLGYSSLLVEERAGTVYVAGVVGSDDDRSSAISGLRSLAGDMPLDASGLTTAAEPAAPPPEPAPSASAPAPSVAQQAPPASAPTPSVPTSEPDSDDVDVVPDPTPASGPYVEATLDGKDFVLAGVVPSAALAGSYLRAIEIAYSPFVRSELVVDERFEPVDWLSRGPDAIVLLPMLIDGTFLISDGQVEVSGRSPDEAGVERLQDALGQMTGLPVVVDDVEVTNLQPPSYVIAADAGVVELRGQVPTEEIREMLVEGAVAAYGSGSVDNQITVDPNVHTSLWMYSGGPLLQAMSTFPDYELRIDGSAFSGFINGGVTFETDSATFSGNYAQVLDVGVSVLTRDQSLQLIIEGHTDDRGPDAENLVLSQRRAEAVRDYFIANGIDAGRLTAVGLGEAEPVVPNDSEEGRARNRRIQYVLSTGT